MKIEQAIQFIRATVRPGVTWLFSAALVIFVGYALWLLKDSKPEVLMALIMGFTPIVAGIVAYWFAERKNKPPTIN